MDCHRCQHIRYDGCRYGHCAHRGHGDVRLNPPGKDGKRPYNKDICPDFKLKKKCSNCMYWLRGRYFSDGITPAKKGECSLRCRGNGAYCPLWRQGPTSGRNTRHAS